MRQVKLSVVIPCYNAATTLAAELEALASQTWSEPWEIVLADNGSSDRSREIAWEFSRKCRNLRVIDASQRAGQPHALNVGIDAARADAVAICDADDVVAPGWVAAMGNALREHEMVACRIETELLNPPWLRGHDQENGLQSIWYPPWLPHAGGGTLGFHKSLFERVGEFDHELPCLHDTDFCFRAQQMGYRLVFVPDAVLHLRKRDSLRCHFRQSFNYAKFNVLLARRYWSGGQPALPFYRIFLNDWIRLARHVPQLRHSSGRYQWVWQLGRQLGRAESALRYRAAPV